MKDMTLYHGSRGGIIGKIQPSSRIRCDFGQGFYMGTRQEQAKTLVYNDPMPVFYTVNFKLSNISDRKILTLADMDWAFYILYNRGRLENMKTTSFYDKIADMDKNMDVIIGPIADDNMNQVMRQFANGDITDTAFLECIRCIDYGIQYVAKTQSACDQIEIKSEEHLDMDKYEEYQKYVNNRKRESEQKIKTIKRQYRSEGKYLDQILDECKNEN